MQWGMEEQTTVLAALVIWHFLKGTAALLYLICALVIQYFVD